MRYVMVTAVDGDLQGFFVLRAGMLRSSTDYTLALSAPVAALTDGDQQDDSERHLDTITIEPPKLPMATTGRNS